MTRNQKVGVGVAALTVIAVFAYFATRPPTSNPVEDLIGLSELKTLFHAEDGWIVLDLPDAKYGVGAIIRIPPEAGQPRWVGNLASCYPAEAIVVEPGALPSLNISRRVRLGAGVLHQIPGVQLGSSGTEIHAVALEVGDFSADALDVLELSLWEELDDNYDLVPASCRALLSEDDTYIVSEAIRLGATRVTLLDSSDARIEANTENVGSLLDMSGDVSVSVDSDGRVEIAAHVTLAVRRVLRSQDGFEYLGRDAMPVTGDSILQARGLGGA